MNNIIDFPREKIIFHKDNENIVWCRECRIRPATRLCDYESIGCTKCWTEAVKHIKGDNGNDKRRNNKIMETSVQYRTNCE